MFEAGSTTEMTVELRVEPDDIFETNETYILTIFVPGSVRRGQNLELLNTFPVVTIVNDDSKLYSVCILHHIYIYIFTFSLFNSNSVSQMLQ